MNQSAKPRTPMESPIQGDQLLIDGDVYLVCRVYQGSGHEVVEYIQSCRDKSKYLYKRSLDEWKELSANGRVLALGEAVLAKTLSENKPDWKYWKNLAKVRLDDAIVLSCDIEPQFYQNRRDIWQVRIRSSIAKNYIEAGLLNVTFAPHSGSSYVGDQLIALADFRQWGESIPDPFVFPDEFPCKERASRRSGAGINQSLSTKERATLLRVIKALALMANLKDRGGANPIEAKLQELGFDGPIDDTIREVLKQARDLSP